MKVSSKMSSGCHGVPVTAYFVILKKGNPNFKPSGHWGCWDLFVFPRIQNKGDIKEKGI